MGTIWVKEFTGGLDLRRLPETTTSGVLIKANNGHINRGGEFEKRAAFVRWRGCRDTVGFAIGVDGVYVFSHDPRPDALSSDINFQRLRHLDLTTALEEILSYDVYANKLYVVARFADGEIFHFYDGNRVEDWYDGRATARLNVNAGNPDDPSKLQQLTALERVGDVITSVDLLGSPVTWATGGQQMASDIAAEINANTTAGLAHGYKAKAYRRAVTVIARTPGEDANRWWLSADMRKGLTMSGGGYADFIGGSDNTASRTPGKFVRTVNQKVYALADSELHFSGVARPEDWTTDAVGAGFVDMAAQTSQGEDLTSVARYQSYLAVFASRSIVIEYIDPDPSLYRVVQVLNNTGTRFPNSVAQFGDSDVFYADDSGLRSLQSRVNTDSAATADIGVPVDPAISDKLGSIASADRRKVIGLIEPQTGNFWLLMEDVIYVFAFYRGAKISAWTTYTPSRFDGDDEIEFPVEYAGVYNRKVYMRSGIDIMVYGGTANDLVYDETTARVWLPFMDAGAPAKAKTWRGVDAALFGLWSAAFAMNPNISNLVDSGLVLEDTTYPYHRIPFNGQSTHISPHFVTSDAQAAKLSSVIIHFDGTIDEDN